MCGSWPLHGPRDFMSQTGNQWASESDLLPSTSGIIISFRGMSAHLLRGLPAWPQMSRSHSGPNVLIPHFQQSGEGAESLTRKNIPTAQCCWHPVTLQFPDHSSQNNTNAVPIGPGMDFGKCGEEGQQTEKDTYHMILLIGGI